MTPPHESSTRTRPPRRKALGQHHLRSGSLCRPLLDFLEAAGRPVLEIGPGGGILTRELLAVTSRVIAWELDRVWAIEAACRLRSPDLQMVVGDALEIPWERLRTPLRVCGNLPYAVATPIITALLERALRVERAAFLVQLEVAERLAAKPGTSPYGALSVLASARAEVRLLGKLGPRAFVPPPKVESAFVGFTRRAPPLAEEEMPALAAVVFAAFSQRRKTLRNALGSAWGREVAEIVLRAAGVDPGVRAERLDVAAFVALFHAVRKSFPALLSGSSRALRAPGKARARC